MFLVVQHPAADLRPFAPDMGLRVDRPTWPLARPGIDFVRSSGSVRGRRRGGVAQWEGEDLYCDAANALRFPDHVASIALGPPALGLSCRYTFRRYYSQGICARVEVGLRLSTEQPAPAADPIWLQGLLAWLALPVRVGPRSHRSTGMRLIDAGPALAAHYLRSSTLRPKPAAPAQPAIPAWWLQPCMPALIVEHSPAEPLELPAHHRPVSIAPLAGSLHHAWIESEGRRVSAWFLRRDTREDARARELRIHLLRLHAERETLRALLATVMQRKLDITSDQALSDDVQRYLNDAIRALERPARFGVAQAPLIDVARAAFDELFAGDSTTLAAMRRQVAAKVDAFLRREASRATTVNKYYGEVMQTQITMGDVTVHGDFNQVTARSIENSFNKAAAASDPALADALKALSAQVAELVKQLPRDKREAAARDLETLTSEATSASPRRAWYELSADGLKEAAKAVASMAAPITTAVGAVLALLAP